MPFTQSRPPGALIADQERDERERFYQLLWGQGSGWVEVAAGAVTDPAWPDKIDLLVWNRQTFKTDAPHTRRFFHVPEQLPALDRYIVELARQWGNVYVSVGLYDSTTGKRPHNRREVKPQPGRVVLVEDGPAQPLQPYTFAVETSSGNYHGYYVLSEPCVPSQLVEFARGAAYLLGTDTSGIDRQQLVRVPTTQNTKERARGWTVRLRETGGPHLTPQQVARMFLPPSSTPCVANRAQALLPSKTLPSGGEGWRDTQWRDALDQAAAPWRSQMQAGGPLLNTEGLPRRLTNPDHKGRRILEGKTRHLSPSGNWDASRDRYHVIYALMCHGYDDGQIAALAERLADFGVEVKGADAIWLDICRCIWTISVEMGSRRRISPITWRGQCKEVPSQKPTTHRAPGRPRTQLDAAAYLGWLLQQATGDDKVCETRKAIAAQLRCSVPHLDRLEHTLREAGCIARHTTANRRDSWLELHREPIDAFLGAIATPTETPVANQAEVLSGEVVQRTDVRNIANADARSTHPAVAPQPDAVPNAGCPTTADAQPSEAGVLSVPEPSPIAFDPAAPLSARRTLVRDAFAYWHEQRRLDPRTGELRRCNVTTARVAAYLAAHGQHCDSETLAALMCEEREREQVLALRALSIDGLRAELRKAEQRLARAQKRQRPTGWLLACIDRLQAELRRREPEQLEQHVHIRPTVERGRSEEDLLLLELDATLAAERQSSQASPAMIAAPPLEQTHEQLTLDQAEEQHTPPERPQRRYDFEERLLVGERSEQLLDQFFSRWFAITPTSIADQKRNGGDRTFQRRDGSTFTVEYKADTIAASTGNAFVELVSVDRLNRDGWARSSTADQLAYYVTGSGTCYVVPMRQLREALPQWEQHYPHRRAQNADDYNSEGVLVPLEELAELAVWSGQVGAADSSRRHLPAPADASSSLEPAAIGIHRDARDHSPP